MLRGVEKLSMEVDARPIEILLIEDNPDDVVLTVEALRDGRVMNNLSVARDGEEAMDFLHKRGLFADMPTPDIILLDLNLPRKDGREVLAEIKTDESLRHIPVVVLTTSSADQDILACYKNYASCYITKPVELEDFFRMMRTFEEFWFQIVTLPSRGAT